MKYIISFVFFIAVSLAAVAQQQLVVDANAELRKPEGAFNAISVSSSIDLYLSQSNDVSVAVSASDSKYRNKIKTVVENGVLKIFYEDSNLLSVKKKKLVAYVSFRELKSLKASGSSDIYIAGTIKLPSLDVQLSGSSGFKADVKLDELSLDISGSSDVDISGQAGIVKIESSGASDIEGYELVTDTCTVRVSGASDVSITVNGELNAHASGASEVSYKGKAVVREMNASGASSVKRG